METSKQSRSGGCPPTPCSPVRITPEKAAHVLRVLAQQEMESASLLTKPRDAGAEFEREYLAAALFMGAVAVAALERIADLAADTEDIWCAMESIEAIAAGTAWLAEKAGLANDKDLARRALDFE